MGKQITHTPIPLHSPKREHLEVLTTDETLLNEKSCLVIDTTDETLLNEKSCLVIDYR